ncbi:hypothetical protein Pmani_039787 [Petrolisthes manimaculis]|uniref:Uncharacterized protein n=1 Tax=Petrolisthes manimaculis TaxID=1843537 RepID=A0AAE1NDQ0_9EUCA|nr:hypothetical protein Pmani_039787 [Petrolisthes manimaculis]
MRSEYGTVREGGGHEGVLETGSNDPLRAGVMAGVGPLAPSFPAPIMPLPTRTRESSASHRLISGVIGP